MVYPIKRNNVIKGVSIILFGIFLAGCANGTVTDQPKTDEQTSTYPAIAVGKGPDAIMATPDKRYIYVANVEDAFVSVIDTKTDTVISTIDTVDYPWGFTRLAQTNFVALSGWAGSVDIIDMTSHSVVRSNDYEQPLGGITSSKDGQKIFVVSIEKNKVLQINPETFVVVAEYDTGKGPDGIGISQDETKLYVANTEDGTISVIDIETNESNILAVGGKPELMHSNRDRSMLYVSNFYENKVHVIDTNKGEILRDIEGLNGPEEAVLSQDEKILYVVNFWNNEVVTFDSETYEKLPQTYAVGNEPIGVLDLGGNRLYVTNFKDNSVSLISSN